MKKVVTCAGGCARGGGREPTFHETWASGKEESKHWDTNKTGACPDAAEVAPPPGGRVLESGEVKAGGQRVESVGFGLG
jgi:hypothetical protein